MLEKLIEVICRYVDIDPSKLNADTNIRSELGLNSLELVNIAVAIEAGNNQGYFYKWVSHAKGTLTLTCPAVEGVE